MSISYNPAWSANHGHHGSLVFCRAVANDSNFFLSKLTVTAVCLCTAVLVLEPGPYCYCPDGSVQYPGSGWYKRLSQCWASIYNVVTTLRHSSRTFFLCQSRMSGFSISFICIQCIFI